MQPMHMPLTGECMQDVCHGEVLAMVPQSMDPQDLQDPPPAFATVQRWIVKVRQTQQQ